MKKIIYLAVLLCCGLSLTTSCGKNKQGLSVKMDNFSSGKAGEIILIMDNHIWNNEDKKTITGFFTQPQPAIPQKEPMFDILEFENKDFNANFQRHRNIVHFDVNADASANTFYIEKNKWTSPQVYVHIKGNDAATCLALFLEHQEEILKELYENDLRRLQTAFTKDTDPNTEKLIRSKFGINISIPRQYFVALEEEDFLWLRYRTSKNDRFIMIYKYPVAEMTHDFLMNTRDAFTKKYIPGALPKSYPVISRYSGFPVIEKMKTGKFDGMEMRGLWESVNDQMGGPFYSFTFLDHSGENYITIDGFVYAPQEDKRNYIREVEAIVKTVR
jgi:hypothetical protein